MVDRTEARDGSVVERVVETIERALLPDGFKVERRQTVRAPDTNEIIAELDIVISGRLGSSAVSWLIECRDRPTEGPAPASWIEQLSARRLRFDFDRVFAVSTTGFSRPAQEFASEAGIPLRTVRTIEDIGKDFGVESFKLHHNVFELTGPVMFHGRVRRPPRPGPEPEIRALGGTEFIQLSPFVVEQLRDRGALPTADGVEAIDFTYGRRCHVRIGSEVLNHVVGFSVPGLLRTTILEGQALAANVYAEDQRIIGKQGQFEWQTAWGPMKGTLTITERQIKVEIPDEQLPPGARGVLKVERIPRAQR
jgi:hypothetical protein